MLKRIVTAALLFGFVLSGCSPSAEVIAGKTAIAASTIAAAWTPTPSVTPTPPPTSTSTPQPTATFTLEPTQTPTITYTPTPEVLFKEDFSANPLKSARLGGAVAWNEKDQNIQLGNLKFEQNNFALFPYKAQETFVVRGRVFINRERVGDWDSVAMMVRAGTTDYYATITYGPKLAQQNNQNILVIITNASGNESWSSAAHLETPEGWWNIKMLVSYSSTGIKLFAKAWADGAEETGWAVSQEIKGGLSVNYVGFRMYGMGTWVDDLAVTRQR